MQRGGMRFQMPRHARGRLSQIALQKIQRVVGTRHLREQSGKRGPKFRRKPRLKNREIRLRGTRLVKWDAGKGAVHETESVTDAARGCKESKLRQRGKDKEARTEGPRAWTKTRERNDFGYLLNVVVQHEFVGVRAHAQRVHFVFHFVLNPQMNQVLRKHVALEQEFVIVLESLE